MLGELKLYIDNTYTAEERPPSTLEVHLQARMDYTEIQNLSSFDSAVPTLLAGRGPFSQWKPQIQKAKKQSERPAKSLQLKAVSPTASPLKLSTAAQRYRVHCCATVHHAKSIAAQHYTPCRVN